MSDQVTCDALVVGAGPAGLMAAEVMSAAGLRVLIAEAKPSVARKFLMAGKSGLNLTKNEPFAGFLAAYGAASEALRSMLEDFGPDAVQDWARGLGQDVFTGSTGRVFPTVMKASPLLRAWMARLADHGTQLRLRWRFTGWDGEVALFDTPDGVQRVQTKATILAMGGASWSRLGSDGAWAATLDQAGVGVAPFAPANAGLMVNWSDHMTRHFGAPVKGIALRSGDLTSRGEVVLSARGIEGGGIYPLSPALREGADLLLDLCPDLTEAEVAARLSKPRGKATRAAHLRKALRLDPVKLALLQEFARPLPDGAALANVVKNLRVDHARLRPLDEAISVAGGVRWDAVDANLMLTARPGTYCAGEMLDWEAPTGGYLLTGCFATGRWAGLAAVRRVKG